MFVVFRKKSLLFCLVLAAAVILGCVMIRFSSAEEAMANKIGRTVVLDAGHGGADGGVTGSVTGVAESEINLAIVKSLKHFLVKNGYDVVLTRENRDGLYGSGGGNLKRRDMEQRKRIISDARPDLVISVHQNFYPLASVKGAQVFYAEDNERSRAAAETIQRTLNGALGSDRTAASGDYFIVQCTEYPSVIVECGFLSNPAEEKLLVSAVYQEKVAFALFTAVHSMLGAPDKAEQTPS